MICEDVTNYFNSWSKYLYTHNNIHRYPPPASHSKSKVISFVLVDEEYQVVGECERWYK